MRLEVQENQTCSLRRPGVIQHNLTCSHIWLYDCGMLKQNRISEVRQAQGLTQDALSKRAGVPLSTLQKAERGVMNPSVDFALTVASALECAVEDIFISNSTQDWLKPSPALEPVEAQ